MEDLLQKLHSRCLMFDSFAYQTCQEKKLEYSDDVAWGDDRGSHRRLLWRVQAITGFLCVSQDNIETLFATEDAAAKSQFIVF